jgi:allantoinase
MAVRYALHSRRVLLPGGLMEAWVTVSGDRIEQVGDSAPEGVPVEELGDAVLMPGLIDSHVHINEPGRTEWEGFETATRAAAAGGITTPWTCPSTAAP